MGNFFFTFQVVYFDLSHIIQRTSKHLSIFLCSLIKFVWNFSSVIRFRVFITLLMLICSARQRSCSRLIDFLIVLSTWNVFQWLFLAFIWIVVELFFRFGIIFFTIHGHTVVSDNFLLGFPERDIFFMLISNWHEFKLIS